MSGLRLATYGTGRLITEVIRQVPATAHELVAAVVHSPERAGLDLGELTTGEVLGVQTSSDLGDALVRVDLLLYGGLLGETHTQVMQRCAEAGVDVIHTGFAHPRVGLEPAALEQLATAAAGSGARILGTGILPGLFTDVLPTFLACGLPDPVTVTARVVSDLVTWGDNVLREELGIGGTEEGTAWRYDAIMRESVHELADAFGLELDELTSEGGLLMAAAPVQVGPIAVAAGQVEGFDQHAIGKVASDTRFDISWLALPSPDARGLKSGIELSLVGGDGQPVTLWLQWAEDPYPGTAARMLKAILPLRRMPPGVYLPAQLAPS